MRDTNLSPASNPEPEKQVKSKKHVASNGEAFTAVREVNAGCSKSERYLNIHETDCRYAF